MSIFREEGVRPLGSGRLTAEGCVADAELAARLGGYKRVVAGSYRAMTPDFLEMGTPPGALQVSTKIDGQLWFLVIDGEQVALCNPKGRVIQGPLPVLEEVRSNVVPRVRRRTILAGELFALAKGRRPRVGDVAAAMSGEAAAPVDRLAFFPFDLLEGGDEGMVDYEARLELMRQLTEGGKRCRVVTTEQVSGPEAVRQLFEDWVGSGRSEGLVVRAGDGRIVKVKPSIDIDAVVVGYTGRAEDPEQVRSLLLALMREDGTLQILGALGNLGEVEARRALMERLRPLQAASTYRHASSDGAMYRLIEPRVVVQFKVSDIQSDDSRGDPVQRMVLRFEDGTWKAVRRMPGVSIIHPVLVRVRDDKTLDPVDVRIAQVLDRVLVDAVDATAQALELPPADIVGRQVFRKETKGKLAVRKLVAWKTNKEALDPSWPAFVLHYTDYSPGRKDPLQRTVRVAPDLDTLRALWEETKVAKKVATRGWNEVEGGFGP